MAERSRAQNSIKIAKAGIIAQVATVVLSFISQRLIVRTLGSDYLGLTGLFSNVLSMLSLVQLGIGTAIVYNMYKPLHDHDEHKVAALVHFYRNVYRIIALAVGVIGVGLTPFLPVIIKDLDKLSFGLGYIQIIYLLSIADIVASYLFAYRVTVLDADQQRNVIMDLRTVGTIILAVVRVAVLYFTHSYVLFVTVGLVYTVALNIISSFKAVQLHPYIKTLKDSRLSDEERKVVMKDASNLSIHTLASFVVDGTDNLIISSFIGLGALGTVAGYTSINYGVRNIISRVLEATVAPLGNLVSAGDKKRTHEILNVICFAFFAMGTFCSISMWALQHDFVTMWLGANMVVRDGTPEVLALCLFVWSNIHPMWALAKVCGLFGPDRRNCIIEMVVNAVTSVALVLLIGMPGVFIGTIIGYFVAYILKTNLHFKQYFEESPKTHYLMMVKYFLLYGAELALTVWLCSLLNIGLFAGFVVKCFICLIVPNGINVLLFRNTYEFKYLLSAVKKYFFRRKAA